MGLQISHCLVSPISVPSIARRRWQEHARNHSGAMPTEGDRDTGRKRAGGSYPLGRVDSAEICRDGRVGRGEDPQIRQMVDQERQGLGTA